SEKSHRWYQSNSTHEYELSAAGIKLRVSVENGVRTRRELSIHVVQPEAWRPDPASVDRDPAPQIVLGRRCYWHRPRNSPADAVERVCWTDDNLTPARQSVTRGGVSTVTAVRLDLTAPAAPIEPPPEIFAWAREVTK